MSRISTSKLLYYTQTYIQDIYADYLRQEGFVSLNGENICWYRVVNQEIVNSICFFTHWSREPVSLEIGYGIHPLFIPPFMNPNVYLSSYPDSDIVMRSQKLVSNGGRLGNDYYSRTIPVLVPWGEDKGLHTLEGILIPKMNSIQSIRGCYEMHKVQKSNRWMHPEYDLGNLFCADFVDEAIMIEDKELYPYFQEWIDIVRHRIENFSEKDRSKQHIRNLLHRMELQKTVLVSGNRDAFLGDLEERKGCVLKLLNNKIGITL